MLKLKNLQFDIKGILKTIILICFVLSFLFFLGPIFYYTLIEGETELNGIIDFLEKHFEYLTARYYITAPLLIGGLIYFYLYIIKKNRFFG